MRFSRLARGFVAAVTAICISFGAASAASAAVPECAGRGVPVALTLDQLLRFERLFATGEGAPGEIYVCENPSVVAGASAKLGARSDLDYEREVERTLDALAAHLARHIDLDRLLKLAR